ncbi:hypothetical protein A5784_10135 [Mycobacterium sp. 852013-50091_SCH5140682]|uniref:DUF3349 domain-containing protein n=1 Tax=Mycobacterium sp. 852013-50091_SCH5140682 TaxID=1834109 RepID=UPI0007EC147B|nr:DUF3349 domain-containing protein [Mycobacterium sp. 852013-50091_SCH5140682]OBC06245.1 hypothetical protein A5784_10135 [Mycobacterium sp. 852013-50091_SCH5140682]
MLIPAMVARVVGFLRAGYPDEVPATYVPLLALLQRQLGDDEVRAVAAELIATGKCPVAVTDIEVAITKAIDTLPSPRDVRRVGARLAAEGWPTTPSS